MSTYFRDRIIVLKAAQSVYTELEIHVVGDCVGLE